MSAVGVYLLAFAAAVCGCLSTDRHHDRVFGFEPPAGRRLLFRAGAWALLAASCAVAVIARGPGIGTVEWFCAAGLGAIAAVVLLPYKPRSIPYLGAAAAIAGIASTLPP